MQYLEEFLPASDNYEIPVRVWRPIKVDKILVIVHGMAEYCERYSSLADWLTLDNIAVVALNHRGHGMDCPDEDLGYLADSQGWQKLIDDLHQTIDFIKHEIPNVPITLFGHSMGSFICQAYVQQYGHEIEQVIFSSTNRINRPKLFVSKLLIQVLMLFKGRRATSALVDYLSFGVFNNKFKPIRTEYDWLTRDNDHVDAYDADPYCGFPCTLSFWNDFIGGMLSIQSQQWPKQIPIHLLSGSSDPVGEFGNGISKLATQLKDNHCNLIELKIYPQARHELTNELNASEVWDDIRNITLNQRTV